MTASSEYEGTGNPIRVLLADDHEIFRQGLRGLLEHSPGMVVVGEAADGRGALESALQLRPDVVLMDIGMPRLNGVDATRQLIDKLPQTKVVGLSMHTDRRFVVEIFKAGAKGYVVKDAPFHELAAAIQIVFDNRVYLSPCIADALEEITSDAPINESLPFSHPLSPRQREVLQLIAEGHSTKEIASALDLGVKTVETHRSRMMDTLHIYTVAGLTRYAIREGMSMLYK
jgi:DNA-binding NarL/FixJ family response regulator